jgi:hypothetical protein
LGIDFSCIEPGNSQGKYPWADRALREIEIDPAAKAIVYYLPPDLRVGT